MPEPTPRVSCETCSAQVAETARICPSCNSGRAAFVGHFNLCECGEFNVHSEWPCWNCEAETATSLPPDEPYFCKRCGHHSVGMGWMFCKFCWDYVVRKRTLEQGGSEEEIPFYSDIWDPATVVRTPVCQSCGTDNQIWRSFCFSCGNYLVDWDAPRPS